jgi:hypothetical protein
VDDDDDDDEEASDRDTSDSDGWSSDHSSQEDDDSNSSANRDGTGAGLNAQVVRVLYSYFFVVKFGHTIGPVWHRVAKPMF